MKTQQTIADDEWDELYEAVLRGEIRFTQTSLHSIIDFAHTKIPRYWVDAEDGHYILDNDTTYDQTPSEINHHKTPDKATRYTVFVTADAGTASTVPERQRASPRAPQREIRLPQTISAAARRARATMRNFCVANKLGACITLTYRELPDDPKRDVDEFIEDVTPFYPEGMPWAIITEGDEETSEHRIHHHVVIPLCRQMHKVGSQWEYGDVHIGINPTAESIRCMVNYLSKEFERFTGSKHRYRKSRGNRPQTQAITVETEEEALAIALSYLPEGVDEYAVYDPQCGYKKIFYWEPHPTEPE